MSDNLKIEYLNSENGSNDQLQKFMTVVVELLTEIKDALKAP